MSQLPLHRCHLSKGQLAAIAVEIEKWKAVEAKKRQIRKPVDSVVENLPQQIGPKASDEAGAMLGVVVGEGHEHQGYRVGAWDRQGHS